MSNLPYETLAKFAQSVFLPLKKGQCVTCMFAAGGGKRSIIKSFLSEAKILKEIFSKAYLKTLFVYVDPDEILDASNIHYLELMYNCLKKEIHNKYIKVTVKDDHNYLLKIKDILSELVNQNWAVIFILNDLEFILSLSPSIYLNLETIMGIDKSKILYLFLSTINILDENVLKNLHNLKYAVSRNIIYFPLLNLSDSNYLIDHTANKLKLKISDKIRVILHDVCDGHPQLLKYSLHILSEADHEDVSNSEKIRLHLFDNHQLKMVCADIWNYLSEKEKELINHVVTTGNVYSAHNGETNYLLNLRLIKKVGDLKYKVYGQLFEEFIKNKLPIIQLMYDQESNKLYFGRKSCEDKFTYQEFKLLVYFITHENELITRDQVAEVMWGRLLYQEKYSDWSIDKTISTIRKKMDALGFPSQRLTTLKKRGFSFSNP